MYNHQEIEKKWRIIWDKTKIDQVKLDNKKPKFYALDMFPYPSGVGLHVGHPKGYVATDIIARQKRMQGFNVLHPMGFDAFGLPAENYAIKTKTLPQVQTKKNVEIYKKQLEQFGCTYDWSREVNTTDPAYYKWTQWAFVQMFKQGLVYESHAPINWCPSCQTGLANEDVEDGKCERCGAVVEKKPLRQWVIKITDYAERLLNDLDQLPEWEESIVQMQKNWIGKSEGATIKFKVKSSPARNASRSDAGGKLKDYELEVFTTRPDTIFGCTYLVVSPEHKLIENLEAGIWNLEEVKKYIDGVKNKSDLERTDLNKDKTGVELQGVKAINPASGEELPIFVADYVLPDYGTGAIMAVPAHDERDFEFAQKYGLEIRQAVKSDGDKKFIKLKVHKVYKVEDELFCGDGTVINSDFLNGLKTPEAKEKMMAWLEEKELGRRQVHYKLNDWVFSRQRYWGEPIPLIFCASCAEKVKSSKLKVESKGEQLNPGWFVDENLPITLPEVDHYEPTGTGESPLANIDEWVNTTCPHCGGPAKRETNTMPQWAGSSWYYLRYCDPHNDKELISKKAEKYWNPIDFYIGGAEHATRHLIYARFWHKFLYDSGVVSDIEPFRKFRQVGLILAEDGRKMSKRWNNVINPDEMVERFGADALRVYEMFMGPFSQATAWNTNGMTGARKFLDKVYNLKLKVKSLKLKEITPIQSLLHKTIKKVSHDIDNLALNTVVSALMILVNAMGDEEQIAQGDYEILLQLIAPLAPHLSEELWHELGHSSSVFCSAWPVADEALLKDEIVTMVVQVNGKVRANLSVPADAEQKDIEEVAMADERVKNWLADKKIVKVIYVKNKLINFVINAKNAN